MENQKKESLGQYLYRLVTRKTGALLCDERRALGLSVEEVAERCNMPVRHVKNAEHGGTNLSWRNAGMLMMFYRKRLVMTLEDDDLEQSMILTRAEYEAHLRQKMN